MPYEAMSAETVLMHGHEGDLIDAYLARPSGPGPIRELWSSTICPAGMKRRRRLPASLPTMAMWPSRPICISAKAKARPRK